MDPTLLVAKCIIDWMYGQSSAVLQALKNFLLVIIAYIDVQVQTLTTLLVQLDILGASEELLWNVAESVLEAIKSQLLTAPPGPSAAICPEFYSYFLDPARALIESQTEGLIMYKFNYQKFQYTKKLINAAISDWESTKLVMMASLEILDDALYLAKEREMAARASAESTP